jgi:MFS family permease
VRWPVDRDTRQTASVALLFCHGLGVSTVVLPLLAVASGYQATTVGVFVAVSGAGQISLRVLIVWMSHRLTERWLILAAVLLLCLSSAAVLLAPSLLVFVLAHLLQGVARGLFWVGLQAQVVRSATSARRPLAVLDFVSGIGLVIGPASIGLVGGSLRTTLLLGIITTGLTAVPTLRLARLPLPAAATARVEARPRAGVSAAVLAAVSTGTWRGLLGSYVPVVLVGAGHATSAVGLLVGLGSATSIAGSMVVGVAAVRLLGPLYVMAALASGAGLAGIGLWPGSLPAVAVLLVVSGVGAGVLQTLSSSLAVRGLPPDERGRAVARAGTYRAVALLTSPLSIAGLLLVVPLGPAMAVVGVMAAAPVLSRWGRTVRAGPGLAGEAGGR